MTHPDDPTAPPLPCLETLMAGTVAMMTAWADPCPRCADPGQRAVLARRLVSNLYFLQHHPSLSEDVRALMAQAHQRWHHLANREMAEADRRDEAAAAARSPVLAGAVRGPLLH